MNNQTKHTPGPWTATKCAMSRDEWRISNPEAWPIFTVLCGRPEARANAHLIAAAPDLLAALIKLERVESSPHSETVRYLAREQARAAIAKAEGSA